jgi:hypothetical protein
MLNRTKTVLEQKAEQNDACSQYYETVLIEIYGFNQN